MRDSIVSNMIISLTLLEIHHYLYQLANRIYVVISKHLIAFLDIFIMIKKTIRFLHLLFL